ncbi:hypothetical protein M378DRAFT_551650 [Amanita muscaria Koide BX008]|uniref:Uncharacterized protein n=1 Tax=Amanita muscaria (strain Koide BX008) TaxID=946122 RepID=A0A0C2WGZ8_AMAMK|nr:hypothetical protein M378DRAFT_551650 [Amanita muscaria Koide BX008]
MAHDRQNLRNPDARLFRHHLQTVTSRNSIIDLTYAYTRVPFNERRLLDLLPTEVYQR